jgi:hypothetical protein
MVQDLARLPRRFVWTVIGLCFLPLLLNLVGVTFVVTRPGAEAFADLPPNQQDRVIRFASELAKTLRQIQLSAERQQKNENAQKSSPHISRKMNNNDRK